MKEAIKSIPIILRKPALQKISTAMFTQSMLSMANFVVGFAVAKFATKSEYGIYVILFSIMGIAGNYQNALINSPLTVLLPQKKESHDKVIFVSGLFYGQWLIFLPVSVATLFISSSYAYIYHDSTILKYACALSVATLAYLFREFIRTINYSKMQIQLLVKMDTLFVALISLGVWMLIVFQHVTSTLSILVLGTGYLITAAFGMVLSNDKYQITGKSIRDAFGETWNYSSWALVGVTSDIFKNQGYIYLVSAMLGLDKIAEIAAARLFLMPIGLFVASSGKIILAKGSDILNAAGHDRFKKFVFSISLFLFIIWLSYSLGLLGLLDYLISFLGGKYANIHYLILLWVGFFLVYSLRYSITTALVACAEFKKLATYDMVGAIITVSSCLILTQMFGGYGTIASLIVGELYILIIASSRLLSSLKPKQAV